ncbi:MAG: ABC-F family ATP-binding cassette domain-containing protein, partial [Candidatus Bipolaricaulota bacterium]|nr:ABC-F family ATP-binding cassette domain-containing protein [Candidatus Bipolaricaulota bacterium]
IALIGDNGTGKSTLLTILAGCEEASAGGVHRASGTSIAYLPQVARLAEEETLVQAMRKPFSDLLEMERTLRRLEEEMSEKNDPEVLHRYDELLHTFEHRGGYMIEAKIRSVLIGVGFRIEEFDKPVAILSGGEEARAALARVLLEEPDLLLLDEPTNHLDFAALDWLEEILIEFSGALILVSHDRHLLDRVTNRTWEIAFESFTSYRGGYTQSRLLREAETARKEGLYSKQQETIEIHKEFIRRHHAGQKHRQAKDRERKLARIEKEIIDRPQPAKQISLVIPAGEPSGKKVLTIKNLEVGFDTRLVACPDLVLDRGERIAIIGANGCGKTTLLKTITGDVPPLSGKLRLGHGVRWVAYTQNQEGLHGRSSVLDAIISRSNLTIGQARGLLGRFLFSGDEVIKKLSALSGGERSRVALALLSLMEGNLILLDEPTNHLDLKSQEILEAALLAYEGTIILVSHDRALLESVATQIWEIRDNRLQVFSSDYRAYRRRRDAELSTVRPESTPRSHLKKAPTPKKKEDKYKERRRKEDLHTLEGTIERAEARLHEIEKELLEASASGDHTEVVTLGEEHAQLTKTLNECYRQWEEAIAPSEPLA